MAAQYPTAAGTDANLFVAVNNKSTSLSDNPLTSGATTVNVASTTGFPTAGYITIDSEAIKYTGVTGTSFTGCTRGADSTTAASHVTATQVFHDVVADHHNVLKEEIKAVEGDLVGTLTAITPVTAASTATSVLNRLAMICSQIKNIGGLTNWYDAVTAMLPKSGGTMTGNVSFDSATHGITGLTSGSSATAGNVGEVVTSSSGVTAFPSTGTYGDLTSISLTAGNWNISISGYTTATSTLSSWQLGVGTVTGNNSTGVSAPTNSLIANGGYVSPISVSNVIVHPSSTTTYFLKFTGTYTGSPSAVGCITAVRIY